MDDSLSRQVVNEVFQVITKYGQMGSLIDVTPVEDLRKHYTVREPPEKAWVVRFHIVFPADRKDIFLVALRNGKIAIEYTLGYDLIEKEQEMRQDRIDGQIIQQIKQEEAERIFTAFCLQGSALTMYQTDQGIHWAVNELLNSMREICGINERQAKCEHEWRRVGSDNSLETFKAVAWVYFCEKCKASKSEPIVDLEGN